MHVGPRDRLVAEAEQPKDLVGPDRAFGAGCQDHADASVTGGLDPLQIGASIEMLVAPWPAAHDRRLGPREQSGDPLFEVNARRLQVRDIDDGHRTGLVGGAQEIERIDPDVGRNLTAKTAEDSLRIDPVGQFEFKDLGL